MLICNWIGFAYEKTHGEAEANCIPQHLILKLKSQLNKMYNLFSALKTAMICAEIHSLIAANNPTLAKPLNTSKSIWNCPYNMSRIVFHNS